MKSGLYHSYLVRFWRVEDGNKAEAYWCGEVESIQTGQTWRFTHLESMLRFLEEGLRKNTPHKGDFYQ